MNSQMYAILLLMLIKEKGISKSKAAYGSFVSPICNLVV
ncbi:hypothetical protein CHCC14814_3598 [Bacillus paralicheniformis]|nr:hypothetical protein CHCC14814_3598 [Bacillus paralicheniformis]